MVKLLKVASVLTSVGYILFHHSVRGTPTANAVSLIKSKNIDDVEYGVRQTLESVADNGKTLVMGEGLGNLMASILLAFVSSESDASIKLGKYSIGL